MEKIEYKIIKDKKIKGSKYESYTVEKITKYRNGKIERQYRTLFPHINGNINEIDLNKVYFPTTIAYSEFKQMPKGYRQAWLGTTQKEGVA